MRYPPPPRRHEIARCSAFDSCQPLFVPFTARELDKLKSTRTGALPSELATLLRRHHTPVRALFYFLDINRLGRLTRHELRAALLCLGIERSRDEVDALFLGILERAIEDGEVTLPFRCVQKALLGGIQMTKWVTSQAAGKQGLASRVQQLEAELEKTREDAKVARVVEQAASKRAAAAEAAAHQATNAAAKQTAAAAEQSGKSDGLRHYLAHVESERAREAERTSDLEREVKSLREQLEAAHHELKSVREELRRAGAAGSSGVAASPRGVVPPPTRATPPCSPTISTAASMPAASVPAAKAPAARAVAAGALAARAPAARAPAVPRVAPSTHVPSRPRRVEHVAAAADDEAEDEELLEALHAAQRLQTLAPAVTAEELRADEPKVIQLSSKARGKAKARVVVAEVEDGTPTTAELQRRLEEETDDEIVARLLRDL